MRPVNAANHAHAWHFNPRIPYGMRRALTRSAVLHVIFQSTHPVWDATGDEEAREHSQDISIHASRMGCDHGSSFLLDGIPISIHASRMGCDRFCGVVFLEHVYFNPRIPYGMRLREWTLHSIIWKLLPALRADYIADIPEHLSVCIFGL